MRIYYRNKKYCFKEDRLVMPHIVDINDGRSSAEKIRDIIEAFAQAYRMPSEFYIRQL